MSDASTSKVTDLIAAAASEKASGKLKKASQKVLSDLSPDERSVFMVCDCHDGDVGVLRHAETGAAISDADRESLLKSARAKVAKAKIDEADEKAAKKILDEAKAAASAS